MAMPPNLYFALDLAIAGGHAAYKCLKTSPTDVSLCRYYVYTLNAITKRLTLHLHPNMKRSMCGRCCMLLIPGVTAMVRHRSKRQSHAVVTCLECGTFKRYLSIPGKVPWLEREENWNDVVVNGVSQKSSQPNLSKKKRKAMKKQQQITQGSDPATTRTKNPVDTYGIPEIIHEEMEQDSNTSNG